MLRWFSILIVLITFMGVNGQTCYNKVFQTNPYLNLVRYHNTFQKDNVIRTYGFAQYYNNFPEDTSFLYIGDISEDSGVCKNVTTFSNNKGGSEYIADYNESGIYKYVLTVYGDTSKSPPFNNRSRMIVFDSTNQIIQSGYLDQDSLFTYRKFIIVDDYLYVLGKRNITNLSVNDTRVLKLDLNLNFISSNSLLPTYDLNVSDLYADNDKIIGVATASNFFDEKVVCFSFAENLTLNWHKDFRYEQAYLNGKNDILRRKDSYVFLINKQYTNSNWLSAGLVETEFLILDTLGQLTNIFAFRFTDSLDEHYTKVHSMALSNNGKIVCVGDYGENEIVSSLPTEQTGFLCAVDLENKEVAWLNEFSLFNNPCYSFGSDRHNIDLLSNNQILVSSRNGTSSNGLCDFRSPWFVKTDSCGFYDNVLINVEFAFHAIQGDTLVLENRSGNFCYIFAVLSNGDSLVINQGADFFTFQHTNLNNNYDIQFYGYAGCNIGNFVFKDSLVFDLLNNTTNLVSDKINCDGFIKPNPVRNIDEMLINISVGVEDLKSVEIYNTIGKLVKHVHYDNNSHLSSSDELPKGTYFVKIYFIDGNVCTDKIVIQ